VSELTFTGERFLPELRGEIWLEHWHRYHFAALVASGARVLDVASGEGYGSALLAAAAREVIGLDASAAAVVVSFETIEHIHAQAEFLAETRRVLAADGLLLLSSPNKAEYTDRRGYANPYHVAELYRDELAALVGRFYPHAAWYGQRIGFCSTILAEEPERMPGELVGRTARASSPVEPLYYIVACAATPRALGRLQLGYSVLGDPDDAIYRDYRDTYRKFVAASAAVAQFKEREAALERDRVEVRESAAHDIAFIQERLAAAEARCDAAQDETSALRAEADRLRAEAQGLKGLTTELGANAHAAQQAALRLTAALDEANGKYAAELAAAQATVAELTRALGDERTRFADALAALEARLEDQAAELERRKQWGWRIRTTGRG
jgi:hypothetical protein